MHELSRIDIGRQVVYLIGFHRVSVAFPRKQLEASSLHLSPSLPLFLFPSSFSPFEFIAVLKAPLPVSRRSLSPLKLHRFTDYPHHSTKTGGTSFKPAKTTAESNQDAFLLERVLFGKSSVSCGAHNEGLATAHLMA